MNFACRNCVQAAVAETSISQQSHLLLLRLTLSALFHDKHLWSKPLFKNIINAQICSAAAVGEVSSPGYTITYQERANLACTL